MGESLNEGESANCEMFFAPSKLGPLPNPGAKMATRANKLLITSNNKVFSTYRYIDINLYMDGKQTRNARPIIFSSAKTDFHYNVCTMYNARLRRGHAGGRQRIVHSEDQDLLYTEENK